MVLRVLQALLFLPHCCNAVDTILGVHNAGWRLDVVSELGVSATRGIVVDTLLKDKVKRQTLLDKLAELKANGVDAFVSIAFDGLDGQSKHRVPVGEDWEASLALTEAFLRDAGGNIRGLVLGNEPTNDYSLDDMAYNSTTGHMPALYWIRHLAKRALDVRSTTGGDYMVIAPDVGVRSGGVDRFPDGMKQAPFIKELVKMAEDEGLDAVDCHLHMADLELLKTAVAKVKSLTSMPLVALEWSQAPIVMKSGWLDETRMSEPFGDVTNLQFLTNSYASRVKEGQWEAFMASNPYNSSFLQDAFLHMKKNAFLYATYGAAFQYGNPKFDSKQLFATMTVKHNDGRTDVRNLPRNEPLYSWFQELVQSESIKQFGDDDSVVI